MTMMQLTIGGQTKRSKFTPVPAELDFDTLPEASRDFVIRYGLKQYLADGVAGAANQTEFNEGVAERLAKLTSGDLTRTRGEASAKVDSTLARALKLAKAAIRSLAKDQNVTLSKEQVDGAAAELVKDEESYMKEAAKQLAQEAKLKDGGAAQDSAVSAILAKLGVGVKPAEGKAA